MKARLVRRALLATSITTGLLVGAAANSAHAQTVVHTFTAVPCVAIVNGSPLTQTQDVTIGIVAPDTVSPGQTFTLTFPGGSAGLPTRSNGLNITSYSNLFQVVQLNNATFNAGSIVDPGTAGLVQSTNIAALWTSTTTYAVNAYVFVNEAPVTTPPTPPDWHFFKSKVGLNLNHPPATSPTQWLEVPVSEVTTWQPTFTYALNQLTLDTADGQIYKSLAAGNLNHQPSLSPAQWTLAPTTTPHTASLPAPNQFQFGNPGPFSPGNPSDAATATLTTPDVSVSATAPASGDITLNMTSLTTHVLLNGGINADVTCSVPNDVILTIPVLSGPTNLSVNAGADVSTTLNTGVQLNGSFVDPDATPTLSWQVDSPFCGFDDATIATPTITCSHAGTFVATLTGHDGINADATDTAMVTVTTPNQPPVVDAGADVSGFAGQDINLNGTVTDPDSSNVTTLWTVDNPTACTFADDSAVDTSVNCDTPGTYAITLTADDGINTPVSDSAVLTINPAPLGLFANAGPNVSGNVNAAITLAGSVTDPGKTPTAHWVVDSPTCNFANPNAASTTITCSSSGVFAATLTGHDGTNPDSVDTALVTVIAPNTPPTVNNGGNVIGKPNTAIPLHGTVTDPDSTPTIHWATDAPANCTFGNANAADTTITCNAAGVYAATLTASDFVNPPVSSTAMVTIVNNFPPVVNAGPDVSGNTNAAIALHGTVTDPDSTPIIQWVTASPSCTFGNPNVADTTITCTAGGVVAATLTANDNVNNVVSDTALVTVTAPNQRPAVSAGPDLTETAGHNALLVGSVTDPDSTPTVHWATGSPACTFGTANLTTTTFSCSVPGIYAATLTASDGVNAPVSATALVTFVPAQCQKPCISIGDAIGYEGASIALPIVLSTPIPTGQTVSVTATIIPGTAGNCRVTPANCDFTAAAVHNLVFSGAQTKYLTVNANRDKTVEPGDPHTFQIKLSNVMPSAGAGNYTIGKGLGVGSIIDASSIGPNVYLVGRSTIPEMDACTLCKATAKFSVALSSNPAATVSVGYHTVNAGATAGADYTSKSGTLTFSPSTSPTLATLKKFISVVTIGDNVVEPTEGIDVVFNPPPPGYSFAGLPGHIDILDND